MFLGSAGCLVDEMGSLKFPEGFLARLQTSVVITQGFERNLLVLPGDTFLELARQISAMSQTDPAVRLLSRLLLGNAQEVTIAADGNVQIPEPLRKFSSLEQDAILVGLGDYFEIWPRVGWEVQLNRMRDFEANATRFTGQNLSICSAA